jgi:hypothetical protein
MAEAIIEEDIHELKEFIVAHSDFKKRLKTAGMDHSQHNQIVNFIWSIADDVLRDVYTRGKYRDIILPFTVLRRLDALLEDSKEAVMGNIDVRSWKALSKCLPTEPGTQNTTSS